jgi:hypothetical protein
MSAGDRSGLAKLPLAIECKPCGSGSGRSSSASEGSFSRSRLVPSNVSAASDLQRFGQQGDYVLPVCRQHALTFGGCVARSESAYGESGQSVNSEMFSASQAS